MDAQTPANSGAFGPGASGIAAQSPIRPQPTGRRPGRIAKIFFLMACGLILGGGLAFLMAHFRSSSPEPSLTTQPATGRTGAPGLAVAAEHMATDAASGLADPLLDDALITAEPKTPARVPQAARGKKVRSVTHTRRRPAAMAAVRLRAARKRARTPGENSRVLGWLRRAKDNVLLRNQRVNGERKKKKKAPCKCATSPTRRLVPGLYPMASVGVAVGQDISLPLLRA